MFFKSILWVFQLFQGHVSVLEWWSMACLHFPHSPSAGSWGGGDGRWPSEQRWVVGVGHRNPPLLHFIRQQTHRQSGSDKDRRTASSDNYRHHSAQAEARESRGEGERGINREWWHSHKAKNKRWNNEVWQRLWKITELIETTTKRCTLMRGIPLSDQKFWLCGNEHY